VNILLFYRMLVHNCRSARDGSNITWVHWGGGASLCE